MTAPASGDPEMSRESLERLLEVLDPDTDRAARRYKRIRRRLERLFEWRGARFPEDLADETLTRVARKLDQGLEIESDDPYPYFCGVAHRLFKEVLRDERQERRFRDPASWPMPPAAGEEADDERMAVLQECLDRLDPEHRELLLEYNEGEGRRRIENRQAMAGRLGVPMNALRIRIHRIRTRLERCVQTRFPGRAGRSSRPKAVDGAK